MSLHDELNSFREKILKCDERIEFWTGIKERSGSASPGYRQACAQLPLLKTSRVELVRAMESHQSQKGKKESSATAKCFQSSPDYRSVNLQGETYPLTAHQARVIQILNESYEKGTPDVSSAYILEALETPGSRLRDTFKSNVAAWKALVRQGTKRGTVRLNR